MKNIDNLMRKNFVKRKIIGYFYGGRASPKKNLLFYYKFNVFNYVFNRI